MNLTPIVICVKISHYHLNYTYCMPDPIIRTPIDDYWYTTAQIKEVGNAWARAAENRLFLTTEPVSIAGASLFENESMGRTGLEAHHLREHLKETTPFPFHIMLSLNRGNSHWTSVAIIVKKAPTHSAKKIINIFFSDSLNVGVIPYGIDIELERIASLFRAHYGVANVNVTKAAYAHAWAQADMASCGPYALKNAERCLAGKEREDNPGRTAIRTEQLAVMREITTINGCSTNNLIDEILIHWIIKRSESDQPYMISSTDEIEGICRSFAEARYVEVSAIAAETVRIRELFIREYFELRFMPIVSRMQELIRKDESILAPKQREAHRKLMQNENIMDRIASIREAIQRALNDEARSYLITAEIIDFLLKMNLRAAEEKIKQVIKSSTEINLCLVAMSRIIGLITINTDYERMLTGLVEKYKNTGTSSMTIMASRPNVQSATFFSGSKRYMTVKSVSCDLSITKEQLEDQIRLVELAISRYDAPFFIQMVYIIGDFFKAIGELFMSGKWQPDCVRIERMTEQLKEPFTERVEKEQLEAELNGLQCLLDEHFPSDSLELYAHKIN